MNWGNLQKFYTCFNLLDVCMKTDHRQNSHHMIMVTEAEVIVGAMQDMIDQIN